jgi:microcystin-dependent protein
LVVFVETHRVLFLSNFFLEIFLPLFLHFPDASYDGGISSSSDDGVLLGRALRDELLLLERDFAGGFKADGAGAGGSSAYAGEIKALAGSTIPAGWLVCDGSAINRIDFSALFAAIGVTWGAGDGSTTFNIPDLRGRTAIGAGKGATGGSVTSDDVTAAKVSEHKLGSYDGSETTQFKNPTLSCQAGVGWTNKWKVALQSCTLAPGALESTSTRNNMAPYAAVTYIIKT